MYYILKDSIKCKQKKKIPRTLKLLSFSIKKHIMFYYHFPDLQQLKIKLNPHVKDI